MKTSVNCLPCIINDLLGVASIGLWDEAEKFSLIKDSLIYLTEKFSVSEIPSNLFTNTHRILKDKFKNKVFFDGIREDCNRICFELAKQVRETALFYKGFDKFLYLINCSVAANALDFRAVGRGYDFAFKRIERNFSEKLEEGIVIDYTQEIYEKLKTSDTVLFITDSVGEIGLDKLLIEYIKEMGKKTYVAVRSSAITTDATLEDAISFGINDIADGLIVTGPATIGISLEEMSAEFKKTLFSTDMIISKGQANFYVLDEIFEELKNNVVVLMRTQCDIVSSLFGETGEMNVAVLLMKEEYRK